MKKVAKNPATKSLAELNKMIGEEAKKIAQMLRRPEFKARPIDIGKFAVDLVLYCQLARINERMLKHSPAQMAPETAVEVGRWLNDLTTRIWNMQVDNEELICACLKEIEEICAEVNAYASGQSES